MSKQQDPDEKGAIPECASRTQLRYLQLNQKLKVALEGERFKEASCLKAQMENLLSEHMTEVRAQVLDASQKMKEARERRCRTTRGRLELQLEEAVLEENYQRASDLKHDLELEKRASHNVSPVVPSLLKRLDFLWMVNEVMSRVASAKQADAVFKESLQEDPRGRLEAELEEAVALEDFSRAAQARDALQPLLVDADRSKMLSTLQNSIEVKRAELRWVARDELRLLHVQLEEAVNGEDFERAEEVFAHISEIERKKMYAALQKQVQEEGALQNERLERGAGGLGAPPPAKLAHRASFSGVIWPLKMISSVQNGSEAPGRGSKALARPAAMTLGGAALQLVEDAPAGKMELELVMFFLAICSISSVPFFLIQKVMTDLSLS